jgi:hypothetical protein
MNTLSEVTSIVFADVPALPPSLTVVHLHPWNLESIIPQMACEYNAITAERSCETQFLGFWRKNKKFYRAIPEGFFDIQP